MKKVMLIEDDTGLNQIIGDRLLTQGYELKYKTDGREGLKLVLKEDFDLLLLDLMLPDVNGIEIIREIRSHGNIIPIIIISARFRKTDKINCLKSGADDYLVKPFDFDELQARIDAHIRRDSYLQDAEDIDESDDWLKSIHKFIEFEDFKLDLKQCELYFRDSVVPLSNVEFRLLAYLSLNSERVVPYDELLEKIWNYNEAVSSRTLYVHIAWLRKKIKDLSKGNNYIRTVRGMGYQFRI